jgi:hypothetical protein
MRHSMKKTTACICSSIGHRVTTEHVAAVHLCS